MCVEWVAGSPWNQWPDVHGIGGRMAVESALRSTIRQREHQLHSSIRSQCSELTCLIRNVKSDLDMIKFNRQLWASTTLAIVAPLFITIVALALIDTVK